MPWVYLLIAGLLEVGWAFAMKQSAGFTQLAPSLATIVLMAGSIGLLGTKSSWDLMQGCDTLLIVGCNFPYAEFYPKLEALHGLTMKPAGTTGKLSRERNGTSAISAAL